MLFRRSLDRDYLIHFSHEIRMVVAEILLTTISGKKNTVQNIRHNGRSQLQIQYNIGQQTSNVYDSPSWGRLQVKKNKKNSKKRLVFNSIFTTK